MSGVPFKCHTLGQAAVLTLNIKLGGKGLLGTNTSLLRKFLNYGQKSFIKLGPVHLSKPSSWLKINIAKKFWKLALLIQNITFSSTLG